MLIQSHHKKGNSSKITLPTLRKALRDLPKHADMSISK
ncbi:MAG: hypothetical protein JWR18_1414 [Segetibacter sp.]|nr:hypothetical protein [Segetibacter sp.]